MAPTGIVKVLLVGARDLDCVDPYNQRPYCILEYGGQKFRSKSCTTHGKDPIWNNAYKFQVNDDNWVKITVKDEVSKRVLGVVEVHIGRALQYGKDEVYLPVRTPDNFEQGVLNAKLRFSIADDNDLKAPKHASGTSTPTSRTPPGSRPGSATSSRAFSGPTHGSDPGYGDDLRSSYNRNPIPNGLEHSMSSNGSLNPFAGPSPSQPSNPFGAPIPPQSSRSLHSDEGIVDDLMKNNQKLSTQIKDLKNANEDQAKLLQLRNAELLEINSVLDESQKENSELRLELEKMTKQLAAMEDNETARAAGSAHTKDDMQKKLSLAEYERQQAEDELSIVQERYEKLLEDTSQLRLNLSNMQAEVTTLRSDLAFSQQEKSVLQAAVSGMQTSSNSSVDQVMSQLEAAHKQLAEMTAVRDELAKRLESAEGQLESGATQSEEMEYLQQQLRRAWTQNLELQSKVRTLEAAASESAGTSNSSPYGKTNGANPRESKDRESKHIAELMSENEFLKEALIEAKLELAQVKEQHDQIRQELRTSQANMPATLTTIGSNLGDRLAKQKSTLQRFLSNTLPPGNLNERVQA